MRACISDSVFLFPLIDLQKYCYAESEFIVNTLLSILKLRDVGNEITLYSIDVGLPWHLGNP